MIRHVHIEHDIYTCYLTRVYVFLTCSLFLRGREIAYFGNTEKLSLEFVKSLYIVGLFFHSWVSVHSTLVNEK